MLELALQVASVIVIVTTVVPMWRSPHWWVRIWDFPRFQIFLVALAILLSVLVVTWPASTLGGVLIGAVVLAALWQLSWIWRYFPFAPLEVSQARMTATPAEQLCLVTTNVCQSCRDADGLLTIIEKASPDLMLAVETDEWWCSRLQDGLQSRYPHAVTYPLSNGYGLTLFSRLELVQPSIRFLVDEAIPSIKTGVRLRSAALIDLYGMHPQPPAPPNQDSIERDTELILVGKEISRCERPAIVLGDLNDVAWSPTTSRFKKVGNLQDPRRGRGFFNTFPAGMPGLRYPLDYIFHTHHFAVRAMQVLPRFGSDHLPLCISLQLGETSTPKSTGS